MLLGLCTFIFLSWKHAACINACNAMLACKAGTPAKVCVAVSITYWSVVPKMLEISIALQMESMNHNDLFIKAVVWKNTSSSFLSFLPPPPLPPKNVSRPQWPSPSLIEILTKSSTDICDSKTGSLLHNIGPLMAWFSYTVNTYSSFT